MSVDRRFRIQLVAIDFACLMRNPLEDIKEKIRTVHRLSLLQKTSFTPKRCTFVEIHVYRLMEMTARHAVVLLALSQFLAAKDYE